MGVSALLVALRNSIYPSPPALVYSGRTPCSEPLQFSTSQVGRALIRFVSLAPPLWISRPGGTHQAKHWVRL